VVAATVAPAPRIIGVVSEVHSGGEALRQFDAGSDDPTLREQLVGWSVIAGVLVVAVGLTLFATAFLVLMGSDVYTGIVKVSGGGLPGTYVVTEVHVSWRGTASTNGTFTSDDGSVVLTGTTLSWDGSDVGTQLRAKYVPSLRDGMLPVGVSEGVAGDIIAPLVAEILMLPVAAVGWWFLATIVGVGKQEEGRLRRNADSPRPQDFDVET
jgi:hypothetical protein